MDLTTRISQVGTMQELHDIMMTPDGALKVSTKVSFLGKRSIQIAGLDGESESDILATKVIQFTRLKGFEYSAKEREAGRVVAEMINKIYELSDKEVAKYSFITRFFCCIRESFVSLKMHGWAAFSKYSLYSKTRWDWLECFPQYSHWYCDIFSYYTLKQYNETFKEMPDAWSLEHPHHPKLFNKDLVPALYIGK